jgi:acylphosphatase
MSRESYRFVVTGRVQGVFFRQSTVNQARRLGLAGWVRNRDDGAVEGLASGAPEALAQLRTWLAQGPPAARVDGVSWTVAEEAASGEFSIRR